MKISVIILNWNGKKDTLECLSSLQKMHTQPSEIIVVDNGSSDDSVSAIRGQFPLVTLIQNKENLGFAEGNNVGIRYALNKGAEALLLLNNDTIVDPNILTAFSSSSSPLQGGKVYLYDHPNQFDHLGGNWNPQLGTFDLIANRQMDDPKWNAQISMDYACGCALFIKKEVFEAIGYLEPKFFLIWEESDFCFRAKKAGFATTLCPEVKLWHKVSASFVGGKPHTSYYWWRNRLLWIERNCDLKQKCSLSLRILIPEILHIAKLYLLKSLQLTWNNTPEKRSRLLHYKAILHGVKDYLLRRFGPGPTWIHKTDVK